MSGVESQAKGKKSEQGDLSAAALIRDRSAAQCKAAWQQLKQPPSHVDEPQFPEGRKKWTPQVCLLSNYV